MIRNYEEPPAFLKIMLSEQVLDQEKKPNAQELENKP